MSIHDDIARIAHRDQLQAAGLQGAVAGRQAGEMVPAYYTALRTAGVPKGTAGMLTREWQHNTWQLTLAQAVHGEAD